MMEAVLDTNQVAADAELAIERGDVVKVNEYVALVNRIYITDANPFEVSEILRAEPYRTHFVASSHLSAYCAKHGLNRASFTRVRLNGGVYYWGN